MATSEFDELLSYMAAPRVDLQEETLKVIIHLLSSSSITSSSDSSSPFHFFSSDAVVLRFIDLMKSPTLVSYILTILNIILVSETSLSSSFEADSAPAPAPRSSLSPESSEKILTIILTYLLTSSSCSIINLSLVFLTNLTIEAVAMGRVLEKIYGNQNILSALMKKFLDHNPQLEEASVEGQESFESDPWQYFSSVLCNLCRDERIQLFLLNKSTNYISLLMKQIRSKNPIRRRGVVGSIRSCLFKSEFHWWLVEELNITTPLLLPLVVNTPFTEEEKVGMDPVLWLQGPDKQPDADYEIQKMLLESLLILCQTRIIRDRLRLKKVYPVIRNLDYYQDNEEVSAAIYEVVTLLIGYEDQSNPSQAPALESPQQHEETKGNGASGEMASTTEEGESSSPLDDVD